MTDQTSAPLPMLQAGPELALRAEQVSVPELGGSVRVRGLRASELFAVTVWRDQALRRLREAQADHARLLRDLPDGATPPEFHPPELDFDELRDYGRYVTHMLHLAVTSASGLSLYTVEGWEICGQHHPGVIERLQAVVERLSGLNQEDVRKN